MQAHGTNLPGLMLAGLVAIGSVVACGVDEGRDPLLPPAAAKGDERGDPERPWELQVDEVYWWERAARELQDAEDGGRASTCSGVVLPDQGPFGKRVALTFDDGPDPEDTPGILAILAAHGAQATFFINGRNLPQDRETQQWRLLQQMLAEGHLIANHSQRHAVAPDVRPISRWERDVTETGDLLAEAHALAGVPWEQRFFRFPYGAASCETAEVVERHGYRIVGWHIDSADWCFADGGGYCSPSVFRSVPDAFRRDFIGYTLAQLERREGGVLLMHDVHQRTREQLDVLLTEIETRGYSFARLDDAEVFPALNPVAAGYRDRCLSDARRARTALRIRDAPMGAVIGGAAAGSLLQLVPLADEGCGATGCAVYEQGYWWRRVALTDVAEAWVADAEELLDCLEPAGLDPV